MQTIGVVESSLEVLSKSLVTVLLAELGDKTMIATATLAAVQSPLYVLMLSLTGYLVANVVPVFVACSAYNYFVGSRWLLNIASGILFIAIGVYILRSKDDAINAKDLGGTFTALLLSEMGDKTQVATVAVAATSGNPVLPLLGGLLGYLLANCSGILLLRLLSGRFPPGRVKVLSAILLILVGVLTLFSFLL